MIEELYQEFMEILSYYLIITDKIEEVDKKISDALNVKDDK